MRRAMATTQALCAALLLQGAAAFQIWLNTNQLPDEMNRRADEWTESKAVIEGLFGLGAPHPTDPMPNTLAEGRKRGKFVQSFGDVPRVLEQPWTRWEEAGNGAGLIEKFENLGFVADEVFLWGDDDGQGPDFRMTLSPAQLDQVAASPDVDEALILVKSFGSGLKFKDNITPSIDHPACGGVVMEVRSEFWCDNKDAPDQPHFEAARYVAASGKRLFIMPPPRDHETKPLPGQMACMMDALYGALGEAFFCSGGFHIVASAYNYGPLKLFPERTPDGDIAQSFTGGILTLQEKRLELCGNQGGSDVGGVDSDPEPEPVVEAQPEPEVVEPEPQPVPEPVPEPVVEPEVEDSDVDEDGDDEDDLPMSRKDTGAPVHSSGLTAAQMVARIKAQRRAGANTKVTVRSRKVRRGRRMRGSSRSFTPTVATEIVAVDEDGNAIDGGNGSGGDGVQGVKVYVSSSSDGDVSDGDDSDGDEETDTEMGGKRSWFQCMKDCMKGCCDGMKKCMKACCEGMKDCMKACCEAMKATMKACCDGMKGCMKACCDGVKKCCEGMAAGMKACCKGVCDCVKAACKCMKKVMFTEEDEAHEAM